MDDGIKKVRSPQFPFIALSKAVERIKDFEGQYHTHPGKVSNVVKHWGYGEKSSGGIQTVAAVVAYGLMLDEGSLSDRKLSLSPLGRTILKDARPGAREEALRAAALAPKILSELWTVWGEVRPPREECVSILHLEKGFTEEAAHRLLRIYDANIRYAKLGKGDNIQEDSEGLEDNFQNVDGDKQPTEEKAPKVLGGKVSLMPGERVIFSHEIKADQAFRLVATGPVDQKMIEAIKAFADFQGKLLPQIKDEPAADGSDLV